MKINCGTEVNHSFKEKLKRLENIGVKLQRLIDLRSNTKEFRLKLSSKNPHLKVLHIKNESINEKHIFYGDLLIVKIRSLNYKAEPHLVEVTNVDEAIKADPTTFTGDAAQEAKNRGAKEVDSSDLFFDSLNTVDLYSSAGPISAPFFLFNFLNSGKNTESTQDKSTNIEAIKPSSPRA